MSFEPALQASSFQQRGTIKFWACSVKEMDNYLDQADEWSDDPGRFEESEPESQYV